MEFYSERLNYRYFTEQDFELFRSVFSDEKVMKYAWIDKIDKDDDMALFFNDFLNHGNELNSNSSYAFAVFVRENERFAGFADIVINCRNPNGGCGEIGYFLLPEHWGKGYATELSETLVKTGFTRLGLHKMSARCNSKNLKSESVMKKVGMIKEGELRKVRFKNGSWDDEKHYGILIEDWKCDKQ
ncbi:ribosomal-protein-alanine N-acetyltransferase [Ruminiclostridium sufflavum DSM 19573]|uniref:Ribosomal-protein-alanine N-acetyltransferase n=1 Tax=Ruminiclostridium sufflavum DSM 19573 TaxID=1121337 RepID=A0A318XL26_9FIRM|nr:GNAT family protein [Ruminiclostridium sufflavum]PYG88233.1 ribosomal-protein-alanine N-acetyltransferase [Ruminiclostridium sufflavum DSM 19573]